MWETAGFATWPVGFGLQYTVSNILVAASSTETHAAWSPIAAKISPRNCKPAAIAMVLSRAADVCNTWLVW